LPKFLNKFVSFIEQENTCEIESPIFISRPSIVSAEKEVLMEFYPPYVESYQQSWAMEFWHKEVLPRAKAAGAANEVLASP